MQTNELKRIHPNMKRMTVARGGKRGKTSGRGGKGQSARAGNKRRPEWRDIIKKIPKLRGRGVNSLKPVSDKFTVINLSDLETTFSANDSITPTILVEKGVLNTVSGNIPNVKILGDGEITKALKISGCAVSGSAKEKIEKVGGTIIPIPSRVIEKAKKTKDESVKTPAVENVVKTDETTKKAKKKVSKK